MRITTVVMAALNAAVFIACALAGKPMLGFIMVAACLTSYCVGFNEAISKPTKR